MVEATWTGTGALRGRHAFVTGGGSGIGAAIALAMAEAGALVTIGGRRREALLEIAAQSDLIDFITMDVTCESSVSEAFAFATKRAPLDFVVANAGAASAAPFSRTSLQQWNEMLAVNLTGTFLTLQHGLAAVETSAHEGRLIAIASTAGLKGYPYVSAYCAAKHGVVGLVRALAQETAHKNVTVNAVCPGFTETPLLQRSIDNIVGQTGRTEGEARASLHADNPQGRFVTPREVAATVLWLCQPDAGAIHGQAIAVSGGE